MRRLSDPYGTAADQSRESARATFGALAGQGAVPVPPPSSVVVSDATPADLGTASAGVSAEASRADHVHNLPSMTDAGAVHVTDTAVTFTGGAVTIDDADGIAIQSAGQVGIVGTSQIVLSSGGNIDSTADGSSTVTALAGYQLDTESGVPMLFGTKADRMIGFFGATPVSQPTGGGATAGGTWTSTEQDMLNAVWTALRNLGLISS